MNGSTSVRSKPRRSDGDRGRRCGTRLRSRLRRPAALARPHRERRDYGGRIWLVTHGAQSAANTRAPRHAGRRRCGVLAACSRSSIPALGRPDRPGCRIRPDDALVDSLLAALDADDGEDQTAWRAGSRLACRLTRAPAPDAPAISFRADATYLVTGGFGGLGLLVARWMAERGARHIALLGRHPEMDSDGVRADRGARRRGASPLQGDVADEASMRAALAAWRPQAPPLRGIMHAAAAFSAAPITELTERAGEGDAAAEARRHASCWSGSRGAPSSTSWCCSRPRPHCSAPPASPTTPPPTSSSTPPRKRPTATRRVLSVNWGTWEVMRLASAQSQRSYREGGLEPMPATEALDALGRLLAGKEPQAVVAQIDWSILKPLHEARRARPFLSRLAAAPARPARRTRQARRRPACSSASLPRRQRCAERC